MKEQLLLKFYNVFGNEEGARCFFAPGRVNLIGEHTDYNGGHVFPCALTIGTYAVVRKRNDGTIRFYSMNFEQLGIIESSLEELVYVKEKDWTNYPMAVIWAMKEHGYIMDAGFDIMYYGTIPNASGLSSSASLEVLTGYILKDLYGFEVTNTEIALISQEAENKFVGVNCGIMDQFAVAMGKKNQAIFLDTATLTYEYAPVKLENAKIVIANTNKKRGLNDSKYNERRSECEEALSELQTVVDIQSLGELTEKEFEQVKHVIASEVRSRRAKHAVYENQRTVKAVDALKSGNMTEFGQLMYASHDSLKEDYEVTGVELDLLVDTARTMPGVIGSRMTGAGFGGCTVSIVENEYVDGFIQEVGRIYQEKIGYAADFYVVDVGDGPTEI